MSTCQICNERKADKHHVKTRGSGGTDHEWNLFYLCRKHHTEIHQIGINSFANKYPQFLTWLHKNSWQKDEVTGKWRHQ